MVIFCNAFSQFKSFSGSSDSVPGFRAGGLGFYPSAGTNGNFSVYFYRDFGGSEATLNCRPPQKSLLLRQILHVEGTGLGDH